MEKIEIKKIIKTFYFSKMADFIKIGKNTNQNQSYLIVSIVLILYRLIYRNIINIPIV